MFLLSDFKVLMYEAVSHFQLPYIWLIVSVQKEPLRCSYLSLLLNWSPWLSLWLEEFIIFGKVRIIYILRHFMFLFKILFKSHQEVESTVPFVKQCSLMLFECNININKHIFMLHEREKNHSSKLTATKFPFSKNKT